MNCVSVITSRWIQNSSDVYQFSYYKIDDLCTKILLVAIDIKLYLYITSLPHYLITSFIHYIISLHYLYINSISLISYYTFCYLFGKHTQITCITIIVTTSIVL